MKYFFLSEIGQNYQDEEGTQGLRVDSLEVIASRLKLAMLAVGALRRQLAGSFKAKPARHYDDDLDDVAVDRILPSKLKQAEGKAHRERLWLERQGCVLRKDGTIDWGLSARTVEYDHDLQKQGFSKVEVKGGRLYLGGSALDTASMVTYVSGPGYAIYVMSATGHLHVGSHSVGHRHHSSLLAGRMVAAAGELKCVGGRLVSLSNKSGHYKPTLAHLLQTLHQLRKLGLPMDFSLTVFPVKQVFSSVSNFLQHLELMGQPDYDLMKLMRYSKHLTDAVLGAHRPDPWRWCDAATGEAAGVYGISNNQRVPHKIVRQWLKSQRRFAAIDVQSGKGR